MRKVKRFLGRKAQAAVIALGSMGLIADFSYLPPGMPFDEIMWAAIIAINTRLIAFAVWASADG